VPPKVGLNWTDTGNENDKSKAAEANELPTDKEIDCPFPREWTLLDLIHESEVHACTAEAVEPNLAFAEFWDLLMLAPNTDTTRDPVGG